MITFEVQDMTCGHCVSSITKAVRAIDQGAQVSADLATHRVRIESTESDTTRLSDAIREAGYTPVPIADNEMAVGQAAPRSGCCCR
ncbi:MAG: heavy-metal-associated domain-containing protein [Pseudomonadota bacterium]|nr:heavy-metal-associated domain-containing protein [Pseudomonadota bacterium]